MKFREYYLKQAIPDREKYANRCGITYKYLQIMLASEPPRKIPRRDLMLALAKESEGKVSFAEVIEHFYGLNPCKRGAKA